MYAIIKDGEVIAMVNEYVAKMLYPEAWEEAQKKKVSGLRKMIKKKNLRYAANTI